MNPILVAAGAFALALGILAGAYQYGRLVERGEWELATMKKAVEVLRERSEANEDARKMSDPERCRLLGGVWDVDAGGCV